MRPRRTRLGYPAGLNTGLWRCTRFNEAEAHAPRKLCLSGKETMSIMGASMRPRRIRLGYTARLLRPRCADRLASMRPRRTRLGNGRHVRGTRVGDAGASMRPRRIRLGYAAKRLSDVASIHSSFNEAEAHTPRKRAAGRPTVRRLHAASMGRGACASDTELPGIDHAAPCCFNGAEAHTPRKPPPISQSQYHIVWFSSDRPN